MTSVVWSLWKWLYCSSGAFHGTTKRTKFVMKMGNFVATIFMFLTLVMMIKDSGINAQRQRQQLTRRPTVSSAMEAYRNRLMAYVKSQSTTTTAKPVNGGVGLRVGGGGSSNDGLVINGFQCERTFGFFSDKNNPRMYHLCARSRDNWYVYHYFCPHGSKFSDGMGKCMQERDSDRYSAPTRFVTRRPNVPSRRTTVRSGLRRTTPRPTRFSILTSEPTTTPTTTTSTSTTTTTTTEEPEAVPEPDSDHAGTENIASSEEASTEDSKVVDVMVNIPGFKSSAEDNMQAFSDEVEENNYDENNEASDEVNMIPESANGPSRLAVVTTTPVVAFSSTSSPAMKKPSPLKRIPLKAMKAAAETIVGAQDNEGDESGKSDTAGGRRPRILNKWVDFLLGKY